jgi:5'-nucleotidase
LRLFVTSDDGIMAPGYAALLERLCRAAHVVVGAASLHASPGTGTAVSPGSVVATLPLAMHGATVHPWGGTASAAVLAASDGMLGPPPRVVLAGVNYGPNVGTLALHSGTFGAALTALNAGRPAIAVSLDDVYSTGGEEDGLMRWADAAAFVIPLLQVLASLPGPVALNVNVPNLEPAAIRGVRPATFARQEGQMLRRCDGEAGCRIEAGGSVYRPERCAPGTDVALLAAGYVSVTAVAGWSVDRGTAAAASLAAEAVSR